MEKDKENFPGDEELIEIGDLNNFKITQENLDNLNNLNYLNNENVESKITQENKETKDIEKIQQELLAGKNLEELEETAAGGSEGTAYYSNAATFLQGGHISEVNASISDLNPNEASTGNIPVNTVSGFADISENSNDKPENSNDNSTENSNDLNNLNNINERNERNDNNDNNSSGNDVNINGGNDNINDNLNISDNSDNSENSENSENTGKPENSTDDSIDKDKPIDNTIDNSENSENTGKPEIPDTFKTPEITNIEIKHLDISKENNGKAEKTQVIFSTSDDVVDVGVTSNGVSATINELSDNLYEAIFDKPLNKGDIVEITATNNHTSISINSTVETSSETSVSVDGFDNETISAPVINSIKNIDSSKISNSTNKTILISGSSEINSEILVYNGKNLIAKGNAKTGNFEIPIKINNSDNLELSVVSKTDKGYSEHSDVFNINTDVLAGLNATIGAYNHDNNTRLIIGKVIGIEDGQFVNVIDSLGNSAQCIVRNGEYSVVFEYNNPPKTEVTYKITSEDKTGNIAYAEVTTNPVQSEIVLNTNDFKFDVSAYTWNKFKEVNPNEKYYDTHEPSLKFKAKHVDFSIGSQVDRNVHNLENVKNYVNKSEHLSDLKVIDNKHVNYTVGDYAIKYNGYINIENGKDISNFFVQAPYETTMRLKVDGYVIGHVKVNKTGAFDFISNSEIPSSSPISHNGIKLPLHGKISDGIHKIEIVYEGPRTSFESSSYMKMGLYSSDNRLEIIGKNSGNFKMIPISSEFDIPQNSKLIDNKIIYNSNEEILKTYSDISIDFKIIDNGPHFSQKSNFQRFIGGFATGFKDGDIVKIVNVHTNEEYTSEIESSGRFGVYLYSDTLPHKSEFKAVLISDNQEIPDSENIVKVDYTNHNPDINSTNVIGSAEDNSEIFIYKNGNLIGEGISEGQKFNIKTDPIYEGDNLKVISVNPEGIRAESNILVNNDMDFDNISNLNKSEINTDLNDLNDINPKDMLDLDKSETILTDDNPNIIETIATYDNPGISSVIIPIHEEIHTDL